VNDGRVVHVSNVAGGVCMGPVVSVCLCLVWKWVCCDYGILFPAVSEVIEKEMKKTKCCLVDVHALLMTLAQAIDLSTVFVRIGLQYASL
jgi:hypothetical protein